MAVFAHQMAIANTALRNLLLSNIAQRDVHNRADAVASAKEPDIDHSKANMQAVIIHRGVQHRVLRITPELD